MAKKFLTPISVLNLSADPQSANEGDIYYNTSSDVLRIYANSSWTDVSSGGGASLPDQSGNSGKYLTTNGTSASWDAINLGTDTTGNYVASITGTTNEIEVTGSGSENAAVTLSLPATINANTTGSAASLTTARTISLGGDLSGSASFNGTSNVTITAAVADDSHNHTISNVDGLQTALDAKLTSNSYTASDVLTKIKTVDGASSGLDADLLDGEEGSYYLDWTNTTNKPDPTITLGGDLSGSVTLTNLGNGTLTATVSDDSHNHVISNIDGLQTALNAKLDSSSYTASDVLTKVKTVDGASSGLDADLLDGQHGSYYQPASTAVTTTTITNYSINPRFSTTIGFGNDTEILKFNDSTNETRSGYWSSKDGFYIQGDSNSVNNVVLKTGNLDISQNAWIEGILGVNDDVSINGTLTATSKSFDIQHPTKENMRLRYGSLEGPENGVYVRGKSKSSTITLPDYWTGLVDEDTITVQLTPIGQHKNLYVKDISHNTVKIGGARGELEFFYFIQAERKDVDKLVVEYDS